MAALTATCSSHFSLCRCVCYVSCIMLTYYSADELSALEKKIRG